MARVISLEQAKAQYVHRFTMEHIPQWASIPTAEGRYYAPQYRSDQEWYDNTFFPGESGMTKHGFITPPVDDKRSCWSHSQTWPVGNWVTRPWTYLDSSEYKARKPLMTTPVHSSFIQRASDGTWRTTVVWTNGSRLTNDFFDTRDEAGRWLENFLKTVDFKA